MRTIPGAYDRDIIFAVACGLAGLFALVLIANAGVWVMKGWGA